MDERVGVGGVGCCVRYEPMQKLAGHAHTPNPSAYVYLNDGPPVRFTHIGGKGTVATRGDDHDQELGGSCC